MSLQALEVLKNGLKQTVSTTGLQLIGAFYLVSILDQIISDSLVAQSVLPSPGMEVGTPLALTSVPSVVWSGLFAVSILASIWLVIGSLRNLVNENFESIDTDYFTEELSMPVLNMIAGTIVFGLAVGIGTMFFVIPGIYLLVSLIFWSIFVAVEGDTFIDALKNSWDLTKGNKIDLFLIGLGTVFTVFVASALIALPNAIISTASPAAAMLLALVASSFGTVFMLATLSHAYNELQ